MKHVTLIEATPHGYVGRCETCQERALEGMHQSAAQGWCDHHERYPNMSRGGPTLSLVSLEKLYRERSANPVYLDRERRQWLALADEIADRLKSKHDTTDGQLDLFGDEGATP